jgi:hypothetical protein
MKAKELMIGDWVYNTHNRQNEQVAEIRSGLVMLEYNDLYEYDEIEPTPLTPEILEKNGWVKNLYSAESYDNEELECLSLWVGEDGKNKWWWHVGVELVTPINYVHELQHALRLCEIEKEVEL